MRYKHIIWDFDGTLFDTYPSMARAFCETMQEAGVPAAYQEVFDSMKIAISETVRRFQGRYGFGQEVLDAYRKRRIELELANVQPFPGAVEVLARVIAAGGDNFICTHRGDSIYALLRANGVDGYFKEITTSAHGFKRKPDPEAVQYLLDKHGMDPAETLMIGDRPLDVQAGQNAGTAGCFFDPSCADPDGAAYPPAQHQITDLRALFDIIGC